jgi:hypothetical protein
MPRRLTPTILACCTAWSVAVEAERPRPAITVLVANRASLPAATIAEMQAAAGHVLGKAGISTTWVDCPFSTAPADPHSPCGEPLGGTRFLVRITRDRVTHHGSIWDATLGYAHVTADGGTYATVLMDRVEELARECSGDASLVNRLQLRQSAA